MHQWHALIIITAQQDLTYVAATGTGNGLIFHAKFFIELEQLVFIFC